MNNTLRILFIGDVVGQPGKFILSQVLKELKNNLKPDLTIANGENLAGGKGITPNLASKCFSFGVDVLTSGNHIWKNKEVFKIISSEPRLLRPANFPPDVPGNGFGLYKTEKNIPVAVINLMGRLNLLNIDCPFRYMDSILNTEESLINTPVKIVDFHAETSSEKIAMGWHLDGRVSAVLGTHTHIQTADEKILPKGTAYISDVGMTGPHDSVLGIEKQKILEHFISQMPVTFSIAEKDLMLNAVIVDIEPSTGKALFIKRISQKVEGYDSSKDN